MGVNRRDVMIMGAAVAGASRLPVAFETPSAEAATPPRAPGQGRLGRSSHDGQRRADLGNGRYLNPVLAGDHPDPTVLKDGDDYYASFSSFDYYPGIVLWHSRDLVNWDPVGPALTKPIGSIYALDLVKHGGRYFIYIPAVNLPGSTPAPPPAPGGQRRSALSVYVIHAERISGPWSKPVEMGIFGKVDPGHVVGEDGKRYLYLADGHIVPISDDGLTATGQPTKVYEGWKYPNAWIDEGFGLEGPKLIRRNGWYYMFSAQGGTAGPSTSHMVVVARSRSVRGPWENCPHNPIVHTRSAAEPWWSRGHATPVEGPDGRWWLAYHGYENGFRTLGRQMLLEPFDWGPDGWPRAKGGDLSRPLPMPVVGRVVSHGAPLSGPFHHAQLGIRIAFFKPDRNYLSRASFDNGALELKAQGSGPADSSPLAIIAGDRSYEVSVEVELHEGAQAGLLLFYDEKLFAGIGCDEKRLHRYKLGKAIQYPPSGPSIGPRFHVRVINDENVASFYLSRDGASWNRIISLDVEGYNHNMAGGFLSLRPALFASGSGRASFKSLRYRALTKRS